MKATWYNLDSDRGRYGILMRARARRVSLQDLFKSIRYGDDRSQAVVEGDCPGFDKSQEAALSCEALKHPEVCAP